MEVSSQGGRGEVGEWHSCVDIIEQVFGLNCPDFVTGREDSSALDDVALRGR